MRNCHLRRGMTRERAAGRTRRGRCKKWEREETRRARERKLSGGWWSARGAGLGRGRRRRGAYAASLYFAGLLQSPIPRRRPPASRVSSPHRHRRRTLPPTRRPMPPSWWKFYESWNLVWRNERACGKKREREIERKRQRESREKEEPGKRPAAL